MRIVNFTVATGPTREPLSIEDAKEHLRIDHHEEDVWLLDAIKAVRQRAEGMLGRALITQSLEVALSGWPSTRVLALPRPPLVSVTSVKYFDENDVEATLAASNYIADTRTTPGRLVLKSTMSWPSTVLREVNGVVVRYVAGYGELASDVPAEIRNAMKLWLGEMYEVRENSAAGGLVTVPNAAEKVLLKYRVF